MTSYNDSANLYYRKTIDSNRISGPWRTIITSTNIGSQSVSYASNAGLLDGNNASYFKPRATNWLCEGGNYGYSVGNLLEFFETNSNIHHGSSTNELSLWRTGIGDSRNTNLASNDCHYLVFSIDDTNAWIHPIGVDIHSARIYSCAKTEGTTWSSWKTVAFLDDNVSSATYATSAGSVAWSNVTGKPDTYTPSTHTHPYLLLSGGTLTGTINFPGSHRGSALISEGAGDSWPYTTILITGYDNTNKDYTEIRTAGSNNNTGFLRLIANGNVGINTSTPSYKLDVSGGARFGSINPADGVGIIPFAVCNTGYSTTGWCASIGTSSGGVLLGHRGSVSVIGTSNTSNLGLMPDGGKIGIGTTSPSYKLDVSGSTNSTTLYENGSRVITAGNIGSQSVSYASNSGALDGNSAGYFKPRATNWLCETGNYAYSVGNLRTFFETNTNIHHGSSVNELSLWRTGEGNSGNSNLASGDCHYLVFSIDDGNSWIHPVGVDIRSERIYSCAKTSGTTWSNWRTVAFLDDNVSSANYATSAGDAATVNGYTYEFTEKAIFQYDSSGTYYYYWYKIPFPGYLSYAIYEFFVFGDINYPFGSHYLLYTSNYVDSGKSYYLRCIDKAGYDSQDGMYICHDNNSNMYIQAIGQWGCRMLYRCIKGTDAFVSSSVGLGTEGTPAGFTNVGSVYKNMAAVRTDQSGSSPTGAVTHTFPIRVIADSFEGNATSASSVPSMSNSEIDTIMV